MNVLKSLGDYGASKTDKGDVEIDTAPVHCTFMAKVITRIGTSGYDIPLALRHHSTKFLGKIVLPTTYVFIYIEGGNASVASCESHAESLCTVVYVHARYN